MTDMEEEQEIVCIVESSPAAEVTWRKNGESLDESSPDIILSKSDNKYSLLIVSVSEDSVGEYSCTAKNSLGEATANVDISGDATPADILSNHIGDFTDKFTLEWSVYSKSVIDMFEVKVRKQGEEKWKVNEVKVKSNETNRNVTFDGDTEINAKLLLLDLEPATKYEVSVASKNQFGLNSHGDLFIFTTKSKGTTSKLNILRIVFLSDEGYREGKVSPKQQPSVSSSSATFFYSLTSFCLLSLFSFALLQ